MILCKVGFNFRRYRQIFNIKFSLKSPFRLLDTHWEFVFNPGTYSDFTREYIFRTMQVWNTFMETALINIQVQNSVQVAKLAQFKVQ